MKFGFNTVALVTLKEKIVANQIMPTTNKLAFISGELKKLKGTQMSFWLR